jgi:regulatory protein
VSPRIVRIEVAGPGRKARRLCFDDGTAPRLTSAPVVKRLGLVEGAELDVATLDRQLRAEEPSAARDRALALLRYRERSVAELHRSLREGGYPEAVAAATVARFVELGLVDDERFAGMWVRSRVASRVGRRRIARELHDKGVAQDTAEAALALYAGHDSDEASRARAAIAGRTASTRKERDRLIRRLVAQGYDLSIAVGTVSEVSGEGLDDAGREL